MEHITCWPNDLSVKQLDRLSILRQCRRVQAGRSAGRAEAAHETRAADADRGKQELARLEAGPQVKN